MHDGLRADLRRLRAATVAGAPLAGDRALSLHCVAFCSAVTRHHTGEDAGAFPALARQYPELGPVIGALQEDHALIAGIVARVEEIAGALSRGEAAERLVGELDGLAAILESHFSFEERRITKALDDLRTDAPAAELLGTGPAGGVVAYDDGWPRDFEAIRDLLWPAVGRPGVTVEHVGSTAVPGLVAKPVIDVDVVVPDAAGVPRAVRALDSLGYEHRGDLGIQGREAFSSLAGLPAHHLYVVVRDSPPHRDHVDLRDHLRRRPDAARRYGAEKQRLAHLLATDRDAYGEGKAGLVRDLLREARRPVG